MGSLFRSEEMSLCQLFLEAEAAYACISELGELGLVQFRDLNPEVNAFQRKFVAEVRRCEEMERKLRFLEKEIKKDEIRIPDIEEDPEAPQPKEMVDLEATLEKMETELREVKTNAETLKQNFVELTELRYVLQKTQVFFEEQDGGSQGDNMNLSLLPSDMITQGTAQLGFVAGVILRERLHAFERMLWRVSRGNVFIRQIEIDVPLEDPKTGDSVNKCVFIIFFQGEQLKARVKKICEGFRATLYPCPETPGERKEMATGVSTRLQDLNTVLGQTQDHRHRVLIAAAKNLYLWMMKAKKIKAIYHTLNLFSVDVTNKCLIAECWVPVQDLEEIRAALKVGMEKSGSAVPPVLNRMETKENPPTFHRLNKFTRGFQNLVDAYGVASYQEVNPALFTTITFPFLFAMMFGDMGHGLIMAAFGAWMVIAEKKLEAQKSSNEIWNMFFGGRYIIMLMGCFSIYTGLIYNDVFSKSFNIFGSSWTVPYSHDLLHHAKELQLDPGKDFNQIPYPIGMDPVWMGATNKINFLNSYKMKISIIFGVLQMLFGVMLSLWNHRFFKKTVNIFCEFIPQILFLLFLFGYLVILVFHKWIVYSALSDDDAYTPACAPSLLITLINMVLFKGGEKLGDNCNEQMFPGQTIIQKIFVLIAVLCVPWMLFIKPFILKSQHAKQSASSMAQSRQEIISAEEGNSNEADEEQFEFGEVFVHQSIHTIEYCLGSVSHTASYLRLWALSLAHAQLSEVLWAMVMNIGLHGHSFTHVPILFCIFFAWAVLTVGVLVLMEGLSAFLHTLRLHWVEFQSKFYGGTGYLFTPFCFKHILQDLGRDE